MMNYGLSKEDSGALKGIAICLLLMHHLFPDKDIITGWDIQTLILSTRHLLMAASFAKICVPVFVFVTAYGISAKFAAEEPLNKETIEAAVARRLKALMIPYWYVFIVFQIVCNIAGIRNYSERYCVKGGGLRSVIYFVTDFLGLADFFGSPTLNSTWWYMSLALLLVFSIPLMYVLVKKLGWIVLPAFFMLFIPMNYRAYMLTALMGITMYRCGTIEKLQKKLENSWMRLLAFTAADIALLAVCCYIRNRLNGEAGWKTIVFMGSTFLVVSLYAAVLRRLPLFTKVFAAIGRHSMNIFLTHTFIYKVFLSDFIYSFRYAVLIWLALLAASLALAVVLEWSRELFEKVIIAALRPRLTHTKEKR